MPLLVRSPAGVELAEAGRHAFIRATRLHDDLQSLGRDVQSLSGQVSGVVRLVANASAVVGFPPERLMSFQAEYPRVEIALNERISDDVLRACLEDRADVGVCVAPASVPSGLESRHFADDPLMVVLPPAHELANVDSFLSPMSLDFRWLHFRRGDHSINSSKSVPTRRVVRLGSVSQSIVSTRNAGWLRPDWG